MPGTRGPSRQGPSAPPRSGLCAARTRLPAGRDHPHTRGLTTQRSLLLPVAERWQLSRGCAPVPGVSGSWDPGGRNHPGLGHALPAAEAGRGLAGSCKLSPSCCLGPAHDGFRRISLAGASHVSGHADPESPASPGQCTGAAGPLPRCRSAVVGDTVLSAGRTGARVPLAAQRSVINGGNSPQGARA